MSPLRAALDLPLTPHSAAMARRAVRDVLSAWRYVDEDWVYDVTTVVSELVGNAVRHAGRGLVLAIEAHDDHVIVSVSDGSAVPPVPRSGGTTAESGRGFQIIEALADTWGVTENDGGKRVWVNMRYSAAMPQQRQADNASMRYGAEFPG